MTLDSRLKEKMTDKEKLNLCIKALQAVHYEETDCFYKVFKTLQAVKGLRAKGNMNDGYYTKTQRNKRTM